MALHRNSKLPRIHKYNVCSNNKHTTNINNKMKIRLTATVSVEFEDLDSVEVRAAHMYHFQDAPIGQYVTDKIKIEEIKENDARTNEIQV